MAETVAYTQILTVELLERELGLATSLLSERLEESLGKFFIPKHNGEKEDEIVLMPQKLINTEILNQEEEKVTYLKAPEEEGLDVFQSDNGNSLDLKVINQQALTETFLAPERSQPIGKMPQAGIFILTGKIRNGTLQFLYNNGLSILIKEICVLRGFIFRRGQIFKIQKLHFKKQEFQKRKRKGGGIRARWRRKKGWRKWRWKNDNLSAYVGKESQQIRVMEEL